MNNKSIIVHIDDTTATYPVTPRVEIRFERDMKMALSDLKKNEDLYRLAWMAAAQAGGTSDAFDPWIDRVTGIDWVKGGDDDVPLAESPSSSGSLPSPLNPG